MGTAGLFPITLPNPEPLHIQTQCLYYSPTLLAGIFHCKHSEACYHIAQGSPWIPELSDILQRAGLQARLSPGVEGILRLLPRFPLFLLNLSAASSCGGCEAREAAHLTNWEDQTLPIAAATWTLTSPCKSRDARNIVKHHLRVSVPEGKALGKLWTWSPLPWAVWTVGEEGLLP